MWIQRRPSASTTSRRGTGLTAGCTGTRFERRRTGRGSRAREIGSSGTVRMVPLGCRHLGGLTVAHGWPGDAGRCVCSAMVVCRAASCAQRPHGPFRRWQDGGPQDERAPGREAGRTRSGTSLGARDGRDHRDAPREAASGRTPDTNGNLLVLSVGPEASGDASEEGGGSDADAEPPARDEDEKVIEANDLSNDVVDHAVEWGIEATPLVWEGEPADAILAAAE